MNLKAFQDAAAVAADVIAVAQAFDDIPAGLATLAADAYTAAVTRNLATLNNALSALTALATSAQADAANAGAAIQKLSDDLNQLVADIRS